MPIRDRFRRSIGGVVASIEGLGCLLRYGFTPEEALFSVDDDRAVPDLRMTVRPGPGSSAPTTRPLFRSPAWDIWTLPDDGFHMTFLQANGAPRTSLVADATVSQVEFHQPVPSGHRGGELDVVPNPYRMPVDQLLLVHHLAHREGLIIHSAGFELGGAAFVVPGVSGAGKSTLTGLVAEGLPDATPLSDERMIVRSRAGTFEAWGTPWMGTAQVAQNRHAPLRALLFPVKDTSHRLSRLSVRETVRRLLGVIACPHFDVERSTLVLATLERLVAAVPAFELRFSLDAGVGDVIRQLVDGESRAA
jgi:hypothetical protein